MTTKEFYETDATNIIEDLMNYWNVQRDGKKRYVRTPFPSKEEFLERYEIGLDDPWDIIEDEDAITEEMDNQMREENKKLISDIYDQVLKSRESFLNTIRI